MPRKETHREEDDIVDGISEAGLFKSIGRVGDPLTFGVVDERLARLWPRSSGRWGRLWKHCWVLKRRPLGRKGRRVLSLLSSGVPSVKRTLSGTSRTEKPLELEDESEAEEEDALQVAGEQ